jgi:Holliday junction resolvase RusA-like endonuclease
MTFYPITPMAAPRLTNRDRWKKRPVVLEYFAFRDEVAARRVSLPIPSKIIFWMPIPPSWSKKKQRDADSAPHEQTPDIDNLLKALMEAVFRDKDAIVWSVWPEKRWSSKPGIEVLPIMTSSLTTATLADVWPGVPL